MTAQWPGKDQEGPNPLPNDRWETIIRTQMPCGQRLKGTGRQPQVKRAYDTAHDLLKLSIRRHIDGCQKCQANPDVKRP